jgi:PAS domain S-box-containing protein/diguanylate cyclase (GGDEF)-like protein
MTYPAVRTVATTAPKDHLPMRPEAPRRHFDFDLAFRHSPAGMALVDSSGRLIRVNPALQAMLGDDENDLQRRTFLDITHPDDHAESVRVFTDMVAGRIDSHETVKQYVRGDGSVLVARRVVTAERSAGGELRYVLLQVEDLTAEQQAREDLHRQSLHDGLTGLATRQLLASRLAASSAPRSVVVVELDDQPRLNTALGRGGADRLTAELARRLVACCGETAGDGDDVLARLTGGDFAVVVDVADAAPLAERIADAMTAPAAIDEMPVRFTVSIGIATDHAGTAELDVLLQQAELASRSRPAEPTRSWTAFHPAMLDASKRLLAIEVGLRDALDRGELRLRYQPIFAIANGRMRSVEALSRWTHPVLGPVSPQEFIGVAEHSALIHDVTAYTLRVACEDLADWRRDHTEASRLAVAVNLSPICLAAPSFPDLVAGCLDTTGLPAENLILELTETALADAEDVAIRNAEHLRGMGIRLAVDDFGTGYSSLSRLARFPISELKLDRWFLAHVTTPDATAPLVRAGVAMASELGLTLTAEGVETPEQLDLLHRYRCPQAQGFHISRPQPATRIASLLGRQAS